MHLTLTHKPTSTGNLASRFGTASRVGVAVGLVTKCVHLRTFVTMKAPQNETIQRLTKDSDTALDLYLRAAQAETTASGKFDVTVKEDGKEKTYHLVVDRPRAK